MKKGSILFIVPYPEHKAPSQRFRVELFEPYLLQQKIHYSIASFMDADTWHHLYQKGSALQKVWGIIKGYFKRIKTVFIDVPKYDYIFIHREAAPLGPPVFEWIIAKLWRKKIIYDFDDAIWIPNTSKENKLAGWLKCFWKVRLICKWSYKIAGGNDYLCRYAKQFNRNVVLIPTCVDMERQHNTSKIHTTTKPVIGWTGSHSTLSYLDIVIDTIKQLQDELDFTFLVIANKKPNLDLNDWQFIAWNEASEINDLLKIDIGIMPLQPDEWSEGKCGFKIIQYLSLGIPAIASPVGVNKAIIEEGVNGYLCSTATEWENKLTLLIQDANLRRQLGDNGREKILAEYSTQSHAQNFISLFS
jgi:glycosyltransferase involved in cell wall biosynthesis